MVFGLLIACGPKPKMITQERSATDDPAAEQAFKQARNLFDTGQFDEADRAFTRFAVQFADDPLVPLSVLYRARIALKLENPVAARRLLEPIKSGDTPTAERASFYDGIALYDLGQYDEAVERLAPFAERMTDPEEVALTLETLFRACREAGRYADAVYWLDRDLARKAEGGDADPRVLMIKRIARRLDDKRELEDLKARLNAGKAAWTLIIARLAGLYLSEGEKQKAAALFDEVVGQGVADAKVMNKIAAELQTKSDIDMLAIGCILPLSGRSRLIGETVLKGVMLAKNTLARSAGQNLSVVVRDSEGDPIRSAEAVEELATVERVAAILGPLDGTAALAAADQAEEYEIPLITLSIREDLTQNRPFVFRNFSSNRAEVRALVGAAKEAGFEKVAILHPETGYGQTMRALMADELEREGLTLSGVVSYDANQTQFSKSAEEIAALDFQVLFLPDSAARVALIAPALAAAGLWSTPRDVEPPGPGRSYQLLLSSTAYQSDLVRRAGRYLEGALIASFQSPEASPGSAQFIEHHRLEYGVEPTYLAGFGHDGVIILATVLRGEPGDREDIAKRLGESSPQEFNSAMLATPFRGFDKQGEPLAEPWILELVQNRFEVRR